MFYGWFVTINGAFYVLIAMFTIPLHTLVAIAIIRTGAIRKRIMLRTLLSLASADIFQLLFHGIGGLFICMGIPLNDTFNDAMGWVMKGLWGVTLIQHVALALNRLKVVTSKTLVREEEFRYFDTSIVVVWIWGLAYTISCSLGYHNLYFDQKNLNWASRGEGSTTVIKVWFWFRLVSLIVGTAACIIVIVSLITSRRALSESTRLVTGRDFRLFMQTTVVFILAITHVGTWNLFPNPDLYLLSVLNMEWVLVCALLPYLNLAMSSDIRKSLLNVLKITDKTATVSAQGAVTVFNVSTYKKALSKSSE